jgi:hypothetical protein
MINRVESKSEPPVSRRVALRRMLLGVAGLGVGLPAHGQVPLPLTVFFYSPETNVNNYSVLKAEFDTFLAPRGGHQFQPFSDRETFERQVATKPRGLFLLSSWHYKQLAGRHPLKPLLVGQANGRALQRHRIFSQSANPADLRSQKIATAGTRDFARAVLQEMLPEHPEIPPTLDILVVPKDIDALMAVGFGAARAAIAAESSADKLARLNQKQRDTLKPIGKGRESLLPVLAVHRDMADEAKAVARLFADMGTSPEGLARLKLLGLEALHELDAHQEEGLSR